MGAERSDGHGSQTHVRRRFAGLHFSSLRFRLALWHIVFTFVCMALYGAVLSQFLKHELRASREMTMRRREHRFLSFVAEDAGPLSLQVHHFLEAAPDTDAIEILDASQRRIYPSNDPGLPLPTSDSRCASPCLSVFVQKDHHWRLLTHQTELRGKPVWLLMAGITDEHDGTLRAVNTGYFLLLPLVLLGSVSGGYLLSRRALRPVGRLTERARQLSLTALDGRLPEPQTGDELQSLAKAWNDLLVRLEAEVNRSTRFTMDLSHDLRSSMTVILANTELSLRRTRKPEEYRQTIQAIQQESTHVLSMLEDMLLAARSAGAANALAIQPVQFEELVLEVYESFRAAAAIKHQELSFRREGLNPGPMWVAGDPSSLRRMVMALVDNAIKYTQPGGRVEVELRAGETQITLSVQDNGPGIPEHLRERVFDRLFRADSARSRKDLTGTGLGLFIVDWIARAHSSRVELLSEAGRGSRFIVQLSGWYHEY